MWKLLESRRQVEGTLHHFLDNFRSIFFSVNLLKLKISSRTEAVQWMHRGLPYWNNSSTSARPTHQFSPIPPFHFSVNTSKGKFICIYIFVQIRWCMFYYKFLFASSNDIWFVGFLWIFFFFEIYSLGGKIPNPANEAGSYKAVYFISLRKFGFSLAYLFPCGRYNNKKESASLTT